MDRKPFEIIAECELVGLPSGTDIGRISAQIEGARRARPEVVRAMTNPPAVHRGQGYVLQTRFVVWADDGTQAIAAVEQLLQDAKVPCRAILPSGRALTEAEVPPPRAETPRQTTTRSQKLGASRRPRKAARKPRRSSESRSR